MSHITGQCAAKKRGRGSKGFFMLGDRDLQRLVCELELGAIREPEILLTSCEEREPDRRIQAAA